MLDSYVAFDLETTGLSSREHEIIEIGALKVKNGRVVERFMEFVKPSQPISPMITEITGITNQMVTNARNTKQIIRDFVKFCEDYVLVGHNIVFDYKFMKKYADDYGYLFEKQGIDTLKIARSVHKELPSRSLEALCCHYCIENTAAHRAYYDALATAKLYQTLAHYYEEQCPKVFIPKHLVYQPKRRKGYKDYEK